MSSHLLGAPVMLARVKQVIRADGLGRATMEDIVRALEQLGFSGTGVRLTPQAIAHLRIPAILHVDGSHFVASQVNDNERIVIYDPPAPPVEVPPEAMAARWDGLAVLVARNSASLGDALAALGIDRAKSAN
jgi:ABC-type bacteriocin/lantibiotic exporter with double-glycine peptidase domain